MIPPGTIDSLFESGLLLGALVKEIENYGNVYI
jgi:hypothetical protein